MITIMWDVEDDKKYLSFLEALAEDYDELVNLLTGMVIGSFFLFTPDDIKYCIRKFCFFHGKNYIVKSQSPQFNMCDDVWDVQGFPQKCKIK